MPSYLQSSIPSQHHLIHCMSPHLVHLCESMFFFVFCFCSAVRAPHWGLTPSRHWGLTGAQPPTQAGRHAPRWTTAWLPPVRSPVRPLHWAFDRQHPTALPRAWRAPTACLPTAAAGTAPNMTQVTARGSWRQRLLQPGSCRSVHGHASTSPPTPNRSGASLPHLLLLPLTPVRPQAVPVALGSPPPRTPLRCSSRPRLVRRPPVLL